MGSFIDKKTVSDIARLVKGEILGHSNLPLTGVSGILQAKKGDLTFIEKTKYLPYINKTKATAIIIERSMECKTNKTLIKVNHAGKALDKVINTFILKKEKSSSKISEKSQIAKNVKLGKNIKISHFAVIEKNVKIGDNTSIGAGSFIGKDVTIGSNSIIHPNVTILKNITVGSKVIIHSGAVIGADGFGFHRDKKNIPRKSPQVGTVIIEDDVEIGANVTIDRARIDATIIKKNTKIDNLVHIAHNVEIGENGILLAQVGIAGSTVLGDDNTVAGQAGITGHVKIGKGTTIASKSGVTKDILPGGQVISGFPAQEHSRFKKITVCVSQLPDLFKKIAMLDKKIKDLDKK